MEKNKHCKRMVKVAEGALLEQGVMETQEERIPTRKERSEVLSDTKGLISDFKQRIKCMEVENSFYSKLRREEIKTVR